MQAFTPEQMAAFAQWQAQQQAQQQQGQAPQYAPPPPMQQAQFQPAPQPMQPAAGGWGQAPQQYQQPMQPAPVAPMGGQPGGDGFGALAFDLQDPSMSYEDGQFGVPNGQYQLRVEKLEPSISKRSGNRTVKARFRVADGQHKNAVVTCIYPIKNSTQRLRGLLEACLGKGQGWDPRTGVIGEERLARCVGCLILGTVTSRPSEDGETMLTSVGGHKAVQPATLVQQQYQQPMQPQPMQQPQQPMQQQPMPPGWNPAR
jgi:hypothetical protein